jgi:hypothetical protein
MKKEILSRWKKVLFKPYHNYTKIDTIERKDFLTCAIFQIYIFLNKEKLQGIIMYICS